MRHRDFRCTRESILSHSILKSRSSEWLYSQPMNATFENKIYPVIEKTIKTDLNLSVIGSYIYLDVVESTVTVLRTFSSKSQMTLSLNSLINRPPHLTLFSLWKKTKTCCINSDNALFTYPPLVVFNDNYDFYAVHRGIVKRIDRYDLITSFLESLRVSFLPNEPDAVKRFVYCKGYFWEVRKHGIFFLYVTDRSERKALIATERVALMAALGPSRDNRNQEFNVIKSEFHNKYGMLISLFVN